MAIKGYDGFDAYASGAQMSRAGWTLNSAPIGSFQTGRFGSGQALRLTNSNSNTLRFPIASDDTISIGIAMRFSNLAAHSANGNDWLLFYDASANVIVRIGLSNDGKIKAGRGDYTSNLICESSAGVAVQDAWNYYEIELTRHASAGEINIYMNGTLVANASSANTGATAIGMIGIAGDRDNKDYDDFYVVDEATALGEMRCEIVRPVTPDTADADFTPSAGSDNYAMVDETIVDDDTTYNSSSTPGDIDLFDLSNLSNTPLSIAAVKPILIARKDNSTTRTARYKMVNGSTTTDGETTALSTSYSSISGIYETNPDTDAAWAASDINSMQLGYEVVA